PYTHSNSPRYVLQRPPCPFCPIPRRCNPAGYSRRVHGHPHLSQPHRLPTLYRRRNDRVHFHPSPTTSISFPTGTGAPA
ncbi:hypothetical protein C8R44DRAFT_987562, partial [Mycena epipterygia]